MTLLLKRFLLFSILAFGLAGCAPLIKFEQPERQGYISLEAGESLGQTFVSQYDGLEAVVLYLKPGNSSNGALLFHVRDNPQASKDLRTASILLDRISSPGFQRLSFTPIESSTNQTYFLSVEIEGEGDILAGSAPGETYIDGALYRNGIPEDRQLTFRLVYGTANVLSGLSGELLTWLVRLGAGLLLFVLPGWGLLGLLWSGWNRLTWPEKLGLGGGLSLAIYPLLFLWTHLVRLQLGPLYAWLPPLAGFAAILWPSWKRRKLPGRRAPDWRSLVLPVSRSVWAEAAFLMTAGLVFGVRFLAIRNLPLPMWGDSYQHTMMAQLLVDHRGLFDSWEPYAELSTFTYHFGFHSLTAVYTWITRLPLPQAVLWTGQILNALAVLFLYPLAMRILRNRWAGIFTVLIAGLLSQMPMFYLNWGRYTQLAGQAILPAAVFIAWLSLTTKSGARALLALSAVLFAGLALTHYRVLIFAVFFFAAFLALNLRSGRVFPLVKRIFWIGAVGGLLFLPWLIRTAAGKLLALLTAQVTTPASQLPVFIQQGNAIGDLFFYLPAWIWLILPVIVGVGLWRRNKDIALTSLWWFMVFLAANPNWLNLPGTGAIGNLTVFIAAYFPASLVLGAAAGWIYDLLCTGAGDWTWKRAGKLVPWSDWISFAFALLIAAAGLWSARQRLNDIDPARFALATYPDLRAYAWIRENVPQEARFLVNSFFAFGGTTVVGSDGGWWIPLLARRQTTLPPLNYASEQGPRPDYVDWVNALSAELQTESFDNLQAIALLRQRGVTHIYIGQQQGRVNNLDGPSIDPEELLSNPVFHPVYHQDRVWIFELEGPGN